MSASSSTGSTMDTPLDASSSCNSRSENGNYLERYRVTKDSYLQFRPGDMKQKVVKIFNNDVVRKLHEKEVVDSIGHTYVLVQYRDFAGWLRKDTLEDASLDTGACIERGSAFKKSILKSVSKVEISPVAKMNHYLPRNSNEAADPATDYAITENDQSLERSLSIHVVADIGERITRISPDTYTDSDGTVRILVLRDKTNEVGWISFDRSSRLSGTDKTPLGPLVEPIDESTQTSTSKKRQMMSLSQWTEKVQSCIQEAAALRTKMQMLKDADPKPTCKICFDATADTAFTCGHVFQICECCADRAPNGCYNCRKKLKKMKLHWD